MNTMDCRHELNVENCKTFKVEYKKRFAGSAGLF